MTHQELIQLLTDSGFEAGWALSGDTLIVWEHEADPPAPLVRPDETPSAD
jgi:hypothetical protein